MEEGETIFKFTFILIPMDHGVEMKDRQLMVCDICKGEPGDIFQYFLSQFFIIILWAYLVVVVVAVAIILVVIGLLQALSESQNWW